MVSTSYESSRKSKSGLELTQLRPRVARCGAALGTLLCDLHTQRWRSWYLEKREGELPAVKVLGSSEHARRLGEVLYCTVRGLVVVAWKRTAEEKPGAVDDGL